MKISTCKIYVIYSRDMNIKCISSKIVLYDLKHRIMKVGQGIMNQLYPL